MSIEVSVKDFERTLKEMERFIEALVPSLDDSLLSDLQNVIDEYEGYLQGDIQELIEKSECLSSEVERLNNELLNYC